MSIIINVRLICHRSLPSRGAWIEIETFGGEWINTLRRSPRGERGLKSAGMVDRWAVLDVAPLAGSVD